MGSKQAEPPQFAISADRIFDGYRWHNDALILIADGIVQSITPRDERARRWSTEVMPPGTILAPGFIDLQVNGGGGILLKISQRRTRCVPSLKRIVGMAPQVAYRR
jgi:N-acetylglucosamine-6-phosphate deacetylase